MIYTLYSSPDIRKYYRNCKDKYGKKDMLGSQAKLDFLMEYWDTIWNPREINKAAEWGKNQDFSRDQQEFVDLFWKLVKRCHLFQTNGILASFYLGYQKWYQKQDLSLITETGTGQISKPEINAGTGLSEKFPLSLALECANNLILDDEIFPTCICCPISIYMTPSIFKGEAQIQPSSGSRIKPLRQLCRKQFETPELDAKVLPGTDVMSEPFLAIAS
ncbi:hypothetical protein MJT46_001453 [Ovis ammon polii x Ovis aries]|nr:hypothetical protein MJT46_001453 [Ovis ammon polii x Ovis aries]